MDLTTAWLVMLKGISSLFYGCLETPFLQAMQSPEMKGAKVTTVQIEESIRAIYRMEHYELLAYANDQLGMRLSANIEIPIRDLRLMVANRFIQYRMNVVLNLIQSAKLIICIPSRPVGFWNPSPKEIEIETGTV